MFWRSENEIIQEFIKLLSRILRYQTSWTNTDFKIVAIEGDNSPLVYEKFFEKEEKYPVVTVGGAGYTRTKQALNSFLGHMQNKIVDMGTRGLALGVLDDTHPLAAALPSTILSDDFLHAIEVNLLANTFGSEEDSLIISLYQDYDTAPTLVASASISLICGSCAYLPYYAEFYPRVPLSGSNYWLQLTTPTDNSYYIGIDNLASNVFEYTYTGSIIRASGSIHATLYPQPVIRIGGAIEGTVTIKCSDKNSTETPRQLADIFANYIELLTQAQIARTSTIETTDLVLAGDASVDEWLKKDIRIKQIRQSNASERRRGENDIIYSYDLAVDYYGEWHVDYPQETLKDIDVEIDSIFPTIYGD